ncbi:3-methyl-2-oxobutanoate hydroxymethyltransferase [Streptomyces melanosporofaciens]|nr:3-methyl-2-oxobutanoate hydroxymethyltransferase [Streptomyces melanosporofaciens]
MSLATSRQSESARAASAAEARYRIDVPIAPARAARVVALDDRAAQVAARLAAHPWGHAEFLRADAVGDLRELGGGPLPLTAALIGADVVVALATEDGGRDTAERIGQHCFRYGITTAGVVLGQGFEADDAVAALRPYARVLLLSADESDVFELLTALRV